METILNESKAREIAENAKLPLSMNETDEVLRAINICSKSGYFKAAVKYGALVMAQWKDKQHKQDKQQLIDEACEWLAKNDSYAKPTHLQVDRLREHLNNKMKGGFDMTNKEKLELAKECKRVKFKQNLKTKERNSIERILDATEWLCDFILLLILWLLAIGFVVVGIIVLFNLL